MFIGREKELETLGKIYEQEGFSFVVLSGRRRVGKTALLNRFVQGKNAIYFTGVESNSKQNLENFSRSIMEYASGIDATTSFPSFQAALEYVFRLGEKKRLILALDEYPYLAKGMKSFASTLQLLIDKYRETSNLMLILCGANPHMEEQVLDYQSPLYGRGAAQMKLMPFDFDEASQCLPRYSEEEKAIIYGVVGGMPQYLLQMNDRLSIEENIKNTFLNPISFFYEEPLNLLKQEVREPGVYTAIISAIAGGANKMAEISEQVGEDTNVCATYLKTLIELGIVKKEAPYGEDTTRKFVYSVSDFLFRFWHRFVPENASLIARGAADLVYQKIKPEWNEYMQEVFWEICRQYLWQKRLSDTCPIPFDSLGRWWGAKGEIPIVGFQGKKGALFAECIWEEEPVDREILEELQKKSKYFGYKKVHFYLFSKSDFTNDCMELAEEMENVTLISL